MEFSLQIVYLMTDNTLNVFSYGILNSHGQNGHCDFYLILFIEVLGVKKKKKKGKVISDNLIIMK